MQGNPQRNSGSKIKNGNLTSFIRKLESSLKTVQNSNLNVWFINEVLSLKETNISRLDMLQNAIQSLNKFHKQPQNQLFTLKKNIFQLIDASQNMVDLAFILEQYMSRTKTSRYEPEILEKMSARIDNIFRQNPRQISRLMRVNNVDSFLEFKQRDPNSPFKIDSYSLIFNEKEAILIFKFVLKPLLESKKDQYVHEQLAQAVKWYVMISDNSLQNQIVILELSKTISQYLISNKSESNISFFYCIRNMYDLLAVSYVEGEPYTVQTLTPLCHQIKQNHYSLRRFTWNWFHINKNSKIIENKIVNIFRNLMRMGAFIFGLYTIVNFTSVLQELKQYDILFHIYDRFIRKEYLEIQLRNDSILLSYLKTLNKYAIGFINRSRLENQEINVLTSNLQTMIMRKNFNVSNQNGSILILLYKIYEKQFHCLNKDQKRFMFNLIELFGDINDSRLYEEENKLIFAKRDFNSNSYDGMEALRQSQKYKGLENLGNTCYINSFMQALFMTVKFRTSILRSADKGSIPHSKPMFNALSKLFSQLGSTRKLPYYVSPMYFKQKVPQPFCSSWQQCDSASYGRIYFDALLSQLKDTQLYDPLSKMFTNKVKNIMSCQYCDNKKIKTQDTFDLILPTKEGFNKQVSVTDIMHSYFEGYNFEKQNWPMCEKCKKKTPTVTIIEPLDFASNLILTVKIFKFEGLQSSKIITPLNLQFTLNTNKIVPQYTRQNLVYQLYAFIVHIGSGVDQGHYKCFARNLSEPTKWYEFDDHYVTQKQIRRSSDFHFGEQQNPYILFYSTKKIEKRISLK